MDITKLLASVHWMPVAVMTVLSFPFGMLWHSKLLFGRAWSAEVYPQGMPKINAPLMFGGTAVFHFIIMSGLSALVSGSGAVNGLVAGLLVSLVFILPGLGGNYLFASRKIRLLAIDAGNYIVLLSLSGLVLGIW